ncbi:MAG TPA: DUF4215 domain-containing protein [Polyangia bacterium]|nr:DUF4215 domain-containing protein [Polyangia bacterium]
MAIAILAAGAGCSGSSGGQGGEGQHCYPNHSCNDGLVCLSNLCVQPPDGGATGGGSGTNGRGGGGGRGGSAAGTGGSSGGATAGTGGSLAGAGGSSGGASAGTGGATAGSGGATAGTGGATAGTGGSAGTGGAMAGSAGSSGTGGSSGGATAGTGGTTGGGGSGGATGGSGGSAATKCGDGVRDPGEACDDHNRTAGDGCGALCQIEAGWQCPTPGSPCILIAVCGDGVLAATETCDDGNTQGGDGCAANCRSVEAGFACGMPGRPCVPICGDSLIVGAEKCDDGNTTDGDGCSARCQVEPGAVCPGTLQAPAPGPCTPSICGNGKKEGNELCDCGTDPLNLPSGCKGPNGLFFGDGTGCSQVCTKEPTCRSAAGTQACANTCGNGAVETGEACDDGDNNAGDGCSPTCTVETGFMCVAVAQDDGGSTCTQPGNSGTCLELPIVYRDFKNESVSGGHPDFFYFGAAITGGPAIDNVDGQPGSTPFVKRYCVPNSSGPSKKQDATNRSWDIATPNLGPTGKPVFNASRVGAGGNPFFADCQFIDWADDGDAGHVPGYTAAANSPLNGLAFISGAMGHAMYRGPAPVVTNEASFGQWWVDGTYTGGTHTVGTLELAPLGNSQYRYASQLNVVTGGFFPIDPPGQFAIYGAASGAPGTVHAVGTEAMLCNIWPYWYSTTTFGAGNGCKADQFLFPPGLFPPDTATNCPSGANCGGKWYTAAQGWYHDYWFTSEARTLFTYDGDFSLQFAAAADMFVFINGTLVADLGGIHQSIPAAVSVTGATGMATITEGGSLDTTGTMVLRCPGGDPYTGLTMNNPVITDGNGHANCTIPTCDCRMRTVNLGLQLGRTYELAIFHANRHPTGADFQVTLSGLQHNRSQCLPRCGDGVRSGNEQCDCGDAAAPAPTDPACGAMKNSDTTYGACTTQCKLGARCGDGILDAGYEECDLGAKYNTGSYGTMTGCTTACKFPHFCGDGILDAWAGEQCDLGVTNGTTGALCSASCQVAGP